MKESSLFLITLFILLLSFLSFSPSTLTGRATQTIPSHTYDVNGDGVVDGEDASSIEQALDGWEMHYELTDVDGDGKTTHHDLVLLQSYLTSLE